MTEENNLVWIKFLKWECHLYHGLLLIKHTNAQKVTTSEKKHLMKHSDLNYPNRSGQCSNIYIKDPQVLIPEIFVKLFNSKII